MASPKQREFFERMAESWDQEVIHDQIKVREIVAMAGLSPGMRIMDVGCGTGVMVPHYLDALKGTGEVVAVDYSDAMIKVAREKVPEDGNLRYVVSDIDRLPMHGNMDRIVCYSCYPHFLDGGATLRHLATGLVDGGRLMVAHSSSRDEINTVHSEAGVEVRSDNLPPMDVMRSLFQEAGLTVERTVDDERMFVIIGRR